MELKVTVERHLCTGQDSPICLHGVLDNHRMYDKPIMLNLQSSANWNGTSNWYPTRVPTQHCMGKLINYTLTTQFVFR